MSFQKFIVGECCLRDAGCFVSVTLTPPMARLSVLGSSCCCVCGTPWGRWEFRACHWRKLMVTWKRYGLPGDDQDMSNMCVCFIYNEMREFSDHVCWARWICPESHFLEVITFSDSETFWLEWYMHAAWRIRVGTYKIIVVVRLLRHVVMFFISFVCWFCVASGVGHPWLQRWYRSSVSGMKKNMRAVLGKKWVKVHSTARQVKTGEKELIFNFVTEERFWKQKIYGIWPHWAGCRPYWTGHGI